MQPGAHGVIVLHSAKKSTSRTSQRRANKSDDALELPESNDPAVVRRLVRRQAALASAGRRKETIAAAHQRRAATIRRQSDTPSSGSCTAGEGEGPSESKPSPGALAISTGRIDPFAVHLVDFQVVRDPHLLPVFFNLFMKNVAPLLDLRLPTQDDRRYGRRYSWQNELPRLALSSPSCFWALMLAEAAKTTAKNGKGPGSSLMTLNFRHLAIRSINKRLNDNPKDLKNDFGLLVGIAVLGSWEKWWGTQEACKAHCDGVKVLSEHFTKDDQPHDLLAQILVFANTFSSDAKPEATDEYSRVVEVDEDGHVGFASMSDKVYIAPGLVRSVCACQIIDNMVLGMDRTKAIQSLTTPILHFNTRAKVRRVKDVTTTPTNHSDADRINLEMGIVIQAAGIAMLNYLSNDVEIAGTSHIDFAGMCNEVADLGRSISHMQIYDPILLWAVVTVFALTRTNPVGGIAVVRMLAERLRLNLLAPGAMESYMNEFVFLQSAHSEYVQALSQVSMAPLPDEIWI